eukprot:TRINITY_DN51313_c0_g1_i1.p1 TRINITY_DN51313_c0_g1~~TRINITY_DN51313_c0_g1_i1.p1  ORF type:complete len:158 (+),score=12.61 TRINITY_DN51313_c0_g1_i1:141-614(+)
MVRRPPRSTQGVSSAASDVYKRQLLLCVGLPHLLKFTFFFFLCFLCIVSLFSLRIDLSFNLFFVFHRSFPTIYYSPNSRSFPAVLFSALFHSFFLVGVGRALSFRHVLLYLSPSTMSFLFFGFCFLDSVKLLFHNNAIAHTLVDRSSVLLFLIFSNH